MTATGSPELAPDLEHPALAPAPRGTPLADCRLSDRQKASVLLQAAGLLSFLSRSGHHLQGWSAGSVSSDGRLFVPALSVNPGRPPLPSQTQLGDLIGRLFVGETVAGRGVARTAVRRLVESWRLLLSPLSADDLVSQILEAAPFLWELPFGAARRSLAGAVRTRESLDLPAETWVAGPASFRRRLRARFGTLPALHGALDGPEARAHWERMEEGEPRDLAGNGQFRAAIAAWERAPAVAAVERIEWARACLALGRYAAGLAVLEGAESAGALALAARFQLHLGELGAARITLKRIPRSGLETSVLIEVAEVAVRLFANRGEPERADFWLRGALAAGDAEGGRALWRAQLVAAGAAWDRGDLPAMDLHLAAARPALEAPDLAWRWMQARAWRAMAEDPASPPTSPLAPLTPMTHALRLGRRHQTRPEAAALWNELGLVRAQAGNLAGADRAFVHAVRLEMGCDGPRKSTLALYNLAEIRLRRGRLQGVAEILARSEAENRNAGNLRGLTQDAELSIRLELAQGRPESALSLARAAIERLQRRGVDWRRSELRLFAARALGWLGRCAEAESELQGVAARTLLELEPEERPALYALAGMSDAATEAARGTPWEPLWGALLRRELPPIRDWTPLAELERYRAARLVFDAELLVPGAAPPPLRRQAIETLREIGAARLALRLERQDAGLWQGLAAYWNEPGSLEGLASLLAVAGHAAARLTWSERGREQVLIEGAGGPILIERECGPGTLRIAAEREDGALQALATLAGSLLSGQRDAEVQSAAPRRVPSSAPESGAADDLIGESAGLRAALKRIARLGPAEMPVLIQGESGTGKELAARRLHRLSRRSGQAFIAVNCAALSETLILSDLFGHSRGAFTGADREHRGVFETAHGGTVFLDEIGDLPLAAQGHLLRVLQEGEIRRLGETAPKKVDVRVLAATHRDLARMVDEGNFRRDLFYRLHVGGIWLPPLRDRGGDVLAIAERLLDRIRSPSPLRLSPDARRRLVAHRWPGNVRELQNVLTVAAALSEDGAIEPEHLELPPADGGSLSSYHQQIEGLRRRLVETALGETDGNSAEAARKLGLSRQALSYLVKQLGISIPASSPTPGRR